MNYKFNFPAIFLIGPTASGKTEQSFSITKKFPVEIISVDSAMVFKGMDIGTSKPFKRYERIISSSFDRYNLSRTRF